MMHSIQLVPDIGGSPKRVAVIANLPAMMGWTGTFGKVAVLIEAPHHQALATSSSLDYYRYNNN